MAPYINSLTRVPHVGLILAVTRLRSRTSRIPRHLLWECRGTRECQSDPRLAATDADAQGPCCGVTSRRQLRTKDPTPYSETLGVSARAAMLQSGVIAILRSVQSPKVRRSIGCIDSSVSSILQHIGGSDRFKIQIKLMSAILICSLETTCHVHAPV